MGGEQCQKYILCVRYMYVLLGGTLSIVRWYTFVHGARGTLFTIRWYVHVHTH